MRLCCWFCAELVVIRCPCVGEMPDQSNGSDLQPPGTVLRIERLDKRMSREAKRGMGMPKPCYLMRN